MPFGRLKIDDWEKLDNKGQSVGVADRDGVFGSDIGADWHYGHCCAQLPPASHPYELGSKNWRKCANDGELHLCYGCPRVFHPECRPTSDSYRWLCELCEPVGDQALLPGAM